MIPKQDRVHSRKPQDLEYKYDLGGMNNKLGVLWNTIQQDRDGNLVRYVDGETEYFNPPMLWNVEYRTTERWLGKPVYAYAFNPGDIAAGSRAFPHGQKVGQPLCVQMFNRNSELVTGYSGITSITVDGTNVNLVCTSAFGNIAFYIKYTKL